MKYYYWEYFILLRNFELDYLTMRFFFLRDYNIFQSAYKQERDITQPVLKNHPAVNLLSHRILGPKADRIILSAHTHPLELFSISMLVRRKEVSGITISLVTWECTPEANV
jgi:hypothetical protein